MWNAFVNYFKNPEPRLTPLDVARVVNRDLEELGTRMKTVEHDVAMLYECLRDIRLQHPPISLRKPRAKKS